MMLDEWLDKFGAADGEVDELVHHKGYLLDSNFHDITDIFEKKENFPKAT